MNADIAAELFRTAIFFALILIGPVLLAAAATGLIIGFLQAVTQLHDQSLSFVPKLVVMSLVILLLLPWGLGRLSEYAIDLIRGIPSTVSY